MRCVRATRSSPWTALETASLTADLGAAAALPEVQVVPASRSIVCPQRSREPDSPRDGPHGKMKQSAIARTYGWKGQGKWPQRRMSATWKTLAASTSLMRRYLCLLQSFACGGMSIRRRRCYEWNSATCSILTIKSARFGSSGRVTVFRSIRSRCQIVRSPNGPHVASRACSWQLIHNFAF